MNQKEYTVEYIDREQKTVSTSVLAYSHDEAKNALRLQGFSVLSTEEQP